MAKQLNLLQLRLHTILVIYDRLCSLLYPTYLLKDGGFACISPSYDENTEMRTFVLFPEHHNLFCIACLSEISI